jgi:dTMP kinase
MSERGRYIVIEGNDGTGKSTQVDRLERRLATLGITCSQLHEPDGVPTASKLRDIIKDGRLERDAWTNVLLFTAARRLNWLQHVEPALEKGQVVVAARNWFSTVVYQGYGQGVPIDKIEAFTRDNIGEEYLEPDLALILSLQNTAIRDERIAGRGELERPDTFESMPQDFQERLDAGYLELAVSRNLDVIDASHSVDEVEAEIWNRVEPLVNS